MQKLKLLLKIVCYLFLYTVNSYADLACSDKTLIFDNINPNQTPKAYRSGLDLPYAKLNISGSAQPNLNNFEYIINQAKKAAIFTNKIFIVDLRQEPHAILNNQAISWFGFRNQVPYLLEQQLINQLTINKKIKIYHSINKLPNGYFTPKNYTEVVIQKIISEEQALKELGVNYQRFLVIDHFAPSAEQIDLFIHFIKSLPLDSWIHFHCRGGKGRTTTFMALYDIIKNAPKLSLKEILKRQHTLGGTKLATIKFNLLRKKWKESSAKDRYIFLQKFYKYVIDPEGYNKYSWSEWNKTY